MGFSSFFFGVHNTKLISKLCGFVAINTWRHTLRMRNARKSAAASQCLPFYGPHIVFCFLLRCFVFVFRSRALPLSLIFENLIKRPLVGPSKVRASIGHKSCECDAIAIFRHVPFRVVCGRGSNLCWVEHSVGTEQHNTRTTHVHSD